MMWFLLCYMAAAASSKEINAEAALIEYKLGWIWERISAGGVQENFCRISPPPQYSSPQAVLGGDLLFGGAFLAVVRGGGYEIAPFCWQRSLLSAEVSSGSKGLRSTQAEAIFKQ